MADYSPGKSRRYSVAPMLDWTDRFCRRFHRALNPHVWLYTEMITTGALIHGDRARFLRFDEQEHPVACQIGGSEPADLAQAARWVEQAGYDEVNLNCGCPSERVQKGAFGACLMAEPALVADGVKAMRDAVSIDVTVKHRIGLDYDESTGMLYDFIGKVSEAGCSTFIVHARNAVLKGLSPKENRDIPPLRYEVIYQLKRDFPHLEIILNGGLSTLDEIRVCLSHVDGVMIGREAWHNPWMLTSLDNPNPPHSRAQALLQLKPFIEQSIAEGTSMHAVVKPLLGLYRGQPGGRVFRQILSDSKRLKNADWRLIEEAIAATQADPSAQAA